MSSEYEKYCKSLAVDVFVDANEKGSKDGYTFDPVTILTIISIIMKIIEFIYNYYNKDVDNIKYKLKEDAMNKRLGFFKRWVIWRHVKHSVKDNQKARYIYDSLLDLVYSLEEEEKNKLFNLYHSEITK